MPVHSPTMLEALLPGPRITTTNQPPAGIRGLGGRAPYTWARRAWRGVWGEVPPVIKKRGLGIPPQYKVGSGVQPQYYLPGLCGPYIELRAFTWAAGLKSPISLTKARFKLAKLKYQA